MFFTGSRFASIFVSIRVSSARMLGYAMTGVFLSILVWVAGWVSSNLLCHADTLR